MTYYGIKINGKALGFNTRSNDGCEFCNSVTYDLDIYGDGVWLVSNKLYADRACITSCEWYNASYETPENSYIGKHTMEVFSVEIP